MHEFLLKTAEELIEEHKEEQNGQTCFNLYTYLETLEMLVYDYLDSSEHVMGDAQFRLDPHEISRYIWVCLCDKLRQNPAGTFFQKMPVLG